MPAHTINSTVRQGERAGNRLLPRLLRLITGLISSSTDPELCDLLHCSRQFRVEKIPRVPQRQAGLIKGKVSEQAGFYGSLHEVLTWQSNNNGTQKCVMGVIISGNIALEKKKLHADESMRTAQIRFLFFVSVGFRCSWWFPFVCVFNYSDTACKQKQLVGKNTCQVVELHDLYLLAPTAITSSTIFPNIHHIV